MHLLLSVHDNVRCSLEASFTRPQAKADISENTGLSHMSTRVVSAPLIGPPHVLLSCPHVQAVQCT